jgi:sugar phosphate isomerase/epimerase
VNFHQSGLSNKGSKKMTESKTAPIAVQLYSLRQYEDVEKIVAAAAEAGYVGVETVHTPHLTGQELRTILNNHQVQVVSAHVPYQAVTENLDELIEFHQTLGNSWLIVPALPAQIQEGRDAEGWREIGRTLAAIGRRCLDADMRLGYHNHAWEMKEVGGQRIIDLILQGGDTDTLFWEPDIAWIVRGGADPEELLERYAGRCPRVHVKDLAPEGQNVDEDGWAAVGHGVLNWDRLLPLARAAGAEWYIVEHDKPKDPLANVQRSLEFLRTKEALIL